MLRSLYIENFIFIQKAQFSFDSGLNIFTGETGAGKSMIFGAMRVGLGDKATSKLLRVGAEKLKVSLTFTDLAAVIKDKITKKFAVNADSLHIQREITRDGKSFCRINDLPITLEDLKKIAPFLIDVHSQHQQQYLLDEAAHVLFYDSFCNLKNLREEYISLYRDWKKTENDLALLRQEKQKIAEQKEFLLASIKELEENLIEEEEYQALKTQLFEEKKKQETLEQLGKMQNLLTKEIKPPLERLRDISGNFLQKNQENQEKILKKWDDLEQILEDFSVLFQKKINGVGALGDVDEINKKLAKVESLRRKYATDIDALQQKKKEMQHKISLLSGDADAEKKLAQQAENLLQRAFDKARELHLLREKSLTFFQEKVHAEISSLGMAQSQLVVSLDPQKIPQRRDLSLRDMQKLLSVYGLSKVSFLYSSSLERKPGRLKKIASGGELSRLMLSLKVILNEKISVFTMLFDEIDTGIGGDVANQVGLKLQQLAQKKQVILVTHLAQIARFADRHFFVFRDTSHEKSLVEGAMLEQEDVVKEITRMLGEKDSKAGRQLAVQMLKRAKEQKKIKE